MRTTPTGTCGGRDPEMSLMSDRGMASRVPDGAGWKGRSARRPIDRTLPDPNDAWRTG
jgi:hypothetical protein